MDKLIFTFYFVFVLVLKLLALDLKRIIKKKLRSHENLKISSNLVTELQKKVIIVSRERFSHFFEFRGEILVSKLHPPAKSPQKWLGGGEWYSSSERAILLVFY